MQKVSNRFAEFDYSPALAIVSVVITHAGFFAFGDRRILFVAIDTLQLFCVTAFLILSGFFLTNKLENPNNPALVVKKRRKFCPKITASTFGEFNRILCFSGCLHKTA
jgi:probable poly-beta-1,6-N-acetyl-D-glucosamine export protein